MAFTQAQLDALEAAIAGGELTVEYQDKRVTYRSLREMLEIRNMMKQAIQPVSTSDTGSNYRVLAKFNKGLGPSGY